MKPSANNPPKMDSVTVELPAKRLKPYQDFAKKFDILASHVLEADIYIELEALDDQLFINLEWIEKNRGKPSNLKAIILEFSPTVYALFSRIAHLLRRSVPEMIADLAVSGSGLIAHRLEEAKTDLYELEECVETVKFARQFHERSLLNEPPIGPTGKNGWEATGLKEVAA